MYTETVVVCSLVYSVASVLFRPSFPYMYVCC